MILRLSIRVSSVQIVEPRTRYENVFLQRICADVRCDQPHCIAAAIVLQNVGGY